MPGIDGYTVLCLHCDGPDGSTTVTDSSGAAHILSANGNAQLDTGQSKFGVSSILFDGSGDYTATADSDDWYFGAGNFTVDFWVRFNVVGTDQTFISQTWAAPEASWFVGRQSGNLRFAAYYDGSNPLIAVAAWTPLTGQWYHVACVRNGTSYKSYIDGVLLAQTTDSRSPINTTRPLVVGARGSATPFAYLNGWLDEIRISKGVARWTTNFTPPTMPYTTGLAAFEGSAQAAGFEGVPALAGGQG